MEGRIPGAAPKGRPLMFRTMRCLGLLLVFVLVVGAPAASAAGRHEPEELSVGGFLSALWETLVDLMPEPVVLLMDGGGGGTGTGGGTDSGDGGPHMDPNGKPTGP